MSDPAKREWHGCHHDWPFRAEAFCWDGEMISGINFLPIASEMQAWLRQKGQLRLMSKEHRNVQGGLTNPYTFSASTIALVLARVVNAAHEFATSTGGDLTPADAEIERIRLYNEILINAARLSEVLIKQLLYCSGIPQKRYEPMALGALLESWCPLCKKASGDTPHQVSLVATLAHPYHLCLDFEGCAMDHMDLVNKRRNSEAAHSDIQMLDLRTVQESRNQSMQECTEILSGFAHMLEHLRDLEARMTDDLMAKAMQINALKRGGLKPEDCNFDLRPGRPFKRPESAPAA